jgi:peptide/nickel transport system substrate-binding protein
MGLLLTGCVVERKVANVESKSHIVYSTDKLPEDFLLLNKKNDSDTELVNSLFEGLVTIDGYDDIMPALAEDWVVSKDKLEYKFNIRDNACWSDGSKIKAGDFVRFFCDILLSKKNSSFNSDLGCIYGAEDYYKGKILANELGIKADGDKILIIRLNSASENFIRVLARPVYALRSDIGKLGNWKLNCKNIKYSGPFIIKTIDDKEGITIEKNTYYWNEAEVTQSKFLIKEKGSTEAALAEFETSEVDIVTNPPISEVSRLVESEDTIVIDLKEQIGLRFNFEEKSVGSILNFRRAIDEIVEPVSIAEKALSEYSVNKNSGIGQNTVNVFKNNAVKKTVNAIKAKEYFKQVPENKKKNIRLLTLGSDKYKKIGNALKESIDKQLGTDLKLSFLTNAELLEAIGKKDFDMVLTNYPVNYQMEKSVSESAVVYLFNDVKIIAKSSKLTGLEVDGFGNLDFKKIERKQEE